MNTTFTRTQQQSILYNNEQIRAGNKCSGCSRNGEKTLSLLLKESNLSHLAPIMGNTSHLAPTNGQYFSFGAYNGQYFSFGDCTGQYFFDLTTSLGNISHLVTALVNISYLAPLGNIAHLMPTLDIIACFSIALIKSTSFPLN